MKIHYIAYPAVGLLAAAGLAGSVIGFTAAAEQHERAEVKTSSLSELSDRYERLQLNAAYEACYNLYLGSGYGLGLTDANAAILAESVCDDELEEVGRTVFVHEWSPSFDLSLDKTATAS